MSVINVYIQECKHVGQTKFSEVVLVEDLEVLASVFGAVLVLE